MNKRYIPSPWGRLSTPQKHAGEVQELERRQAELREKITSLAKEQATIFREIDEEIDRAGLDRLKVWSLGKEGEKIDIQYPKLGALKKEYNRLENELRYLFIKNTRLTVDILALLPVELEEEGED